MNRSSRAMMIIGVSAVVTTLLPRADGAYIHMDAPYDYTLKQGWGYGMFIYVENRGLGGEPTDGIRGKFQGPGILDATWYGMGESSTDFYHGYPMLSEVYNDPITSDGAFERIVDGHGPVDTGPKEVYRCNFTFHPSLSWFQVPAQVTVTLSDTQFISPSGSDQPHTNLTPTVIIDGYFSRPNAALPADVNFSGSVGVDDLAIVASQWRTPGGRPGIDTYDGLIYRDVFLPFVGVQSLGILGGSWGATTGGSIMSGSSVPLPFALPAGMLLGGALLGRRRR